MFRPALLGTALLVLLAALAAACDDDNGNGETVEGRLKVVTTVSPITSLAENIGGTRIDLQGLVPQGVDSHTYEPPVSDARVLADADLIVLNGLQLEEPTLRLAEANKKADAVILLLGENTVTPDQYKFDFSFPEEEGMPNPHLWTDPVLAMRYAELIHEHLVQLDPDNSDYYTANYEELTRRLQALDEAIQTAIATIPEGNRKLLTYHDSWPYFAERYGMEVIGAIQPSDFSEPSPREVVRIIEQIREENVPAIFGSEVFPSPVLEQIAGETGAEYVEDLRDDDLPGQPGDDMHSYIGMMIENIRIMVTYLGGDASAVDDIDPSLVFDDGPSPANYRT